MRFMNQYEIENAYGRYGKRDDVFGAAVRTLYDLMEWAMDNSDGWAYWPKPARAAKGLMEIVEPRLWTDGREPISVATYRKAVAPIKAFRTKQGADFEIEEVA